MKAFKATYTKNGSGPETKLIGAHTFTAAAKKAEFEEQDDAMKQLTLVSLETTDEVIL